MNMYTYTQSLQIMLIPYLLLLVLWLPMTVVVHKFTSDHLLTIFWVDIFGTIIIFLFSFLRNNTSIYDPYWHIPPFNILLHLYFIIQLNTYRIYILLIPAIYFTRHNYNYFKFWPGLSYEDFRYLRFQTVFQSKLLYWIFSFLGLHIVPTLMVYFGLWPTYFALLAEDQPNQLLFYVGVIIALFGIIFESIADEQLRPWRGKTTQAYIFVGLWKYSRHPNYFGECVFWWGLYLMNLAYGVEYWYTIIGPIIIQGVFVFYSIPVMEKHLIAKKPKYNQYQKNVSIFFPMLPNEQKMD